MTAVALRATQSSDICPCSPGASLPSLSRGKTLAGEPKGSAGAQLPLLALADPRGCR